MAICAFCREAGLPKGMKICDRCRHLAGELYGPVRVPTFRADDTASLLLDVGRWLCMAGFVVGLWVVGEEWRYTQTAPRTSLTTVLQVGGAGLALVSLGGYLGLRGLRICLRQLAREDV